MSDNTDKASPDARPAGTIRLGSKRARSAGKPTNDEMVISIDRANPILGNRHYLRDHLDSKERARVVAAYERDLIADEKVRGPMTRAIEDIAAKVTAGESVILMCWCYPEFRPCHGEHIVRRVERIVKETTGE